MSNGINRSQIPELVRVSLAKAAKSWDSLHGTWADQAPEYWFTVHVAQHLHKKLHADKNWIGLESRVGESLSLTGVKRLGRPRKTLRRNGRCDIVVTRANEKPFAAIEVKSPVYSFTDVVKKDVERLCGMLLHVGKSNSLSIACLGLYSSHQKREVLVKRFEKNLAQVKIICENENEKLKAQQCSKITLPKDGTGCWGTQCIYLERK